MYSIYLCVCAHARVCSRGGMEAGVWVVHSTVSVVFRGQRSGVVFLLHHLRPGD